MTEEHIGGHVMCVCPCCGRELGVDADGVICIVIVMVVCYYFSLLSFAVDGFEHLHLHLQFVGLGGV